MIPPNRPRRLVARMAAGALLLGLPLAAGRAHATPLTISGWPKITAHVEDATLVWATTVTNRLRGFDYWATEVSRVPLGTNGPRGVPETPVVVRTQAGPLGPVAVTPGPGGTFTLLARGRGFAPPVIWCCDAQGVEVVMESDGRDDAPRALAAGVDGSRVRMLLASAGAVRLVSASPQPEGAPPRTQVIFPGRPREPLAVIAGNRVAWVDVASPNEVRTGVLGDGGVAVGLPLPRFGPVVGLWITAAGTVVVASRVGGIVQVARHDPAAGGFRRLVVFRGSRVPALDVAGGVVAIADGRRILAGRGLLAEVRRTTGVVSAVATDGRRLAIFERLSGKAGLRRTAVRLVRVPR